MKKIAILGFGIVGSGVAEVLTQNKISIESKLGEEIEIKYILDLRDFPDSPFGDRVVHDFNVILNDPEVCLVAEMMGGSHPAYDFSKAALLAKKNVVTSNKEVVARFGAELLALAAENGVRYMFEASVGGGIPIIRPMVCDLVSNKITSIDGILNGTTNYILTQMSEFGADFGNALKEAQAKGYAEANPTADVEGLDAARKIVILAALAFGKCISPDDISIEGITSVTTEDFKVAAELGYTIKLIGHAEQLGDKTLATVAPRFVPLTSPLAHISDVYNGILVGANMLDQVLFYGKGAGKLPTASAVVADIIDILEHIGSNQLATISWADASPCDIASADDYISRFCIIASNQGALDCDKAEKICTVCGKAAVITKPMTRPQCDALACELGLDVSSVYRIL